MNTDAQLEPQNRSHGDLCINVGSHDLAARNLWNNNICRTSETWMQQVTRIHFLSSFGTIENHLVSNKFAKPSDDPVTIKTGADKRAKTAATSKTNGLC